MSGTLTRENLLERLEVRITEKELQDRIKALAAQINKDFAGSEKLIVIGVLKGSFLFLADLIRNLEIPCHVEFVRLASYGNEKKSSGTVKAVDLSLPELTDEDILIVEDIIDTGLTLQFFKEYLHSLHKPKSLKLAVLLDKPETRQADVTIDYKGFTVANEFLVGYGLDFAGYYRNLPYIGVVQEEVKK